MRDRGTWRIWLRSASNPVKAGDWIGPGADLFTGLAGPLAGLSLFEHAQGTDGRPRGDIAQPVFPPQGPHDGNERAQGGTRPVLQILERTDTAARAHCQGRLVDVLSQAQRLELLAHKGFEFFNGVVHYP